MQLALEGGQALRGDLLLRAVQRFDLVPVPSTLEARIRIDSTIERLVQEGRTVQAGSGRDTYRIVKVRRAGGDKMQGGSEPVRAVDVTALLDGCHRIAYRTERAIIKERKSFGEVYRACGASARITEDIPTHRFSCFAGQVPSFAIAQLLQEECAAPVWDGARLAFRRIEELFKARPAEKLAQDATELIESGFLERHQVPSGFSVDPAGRVIHGNREKARGAVFLPRTPLRILNNLTRCLVAKRIADGSFAGHVRAGDVVEVAGEALVVITAAHTWETGADGGGSNQSSRLWLGVLEDGR